MSLIGYADLHRPVPFASGRIFYAFGAGSFQLEPSRCSVLMSGEERVEFQLDLIRALTDQDSRAVLSCTLSADYATEEALARVREINPSASLSSCVLTDWWFRFVPTPALSSRRELIAPVILASNGLGTARLMMYLSLESGLILEEILQGQGGGLEAVAEAQTTGVSPRLPLVVRFESSALLRDLLQLADDSDALPRRLIVGYFSGDLTELPMDISGTVDAASVSPFAETMTDRVIARFGRYVPSQEIGDAPVVRLENPSDNSTIMWSLSQSFLATRRIVLPVDLLSVAQAQIDNLGIGSLVRRRDVVMLPTFGQSRVTVLCNLPAARIGVVALGVTLTFPPHPPERPQTRTITAQFETVDDIAKVDVQLSPDEPLRYKYSTFAVLFDESGMRQLNADNAEGEGTLLHLSPEHFPIDFALIEATPALGEAAIVSGNCAYEMEGQLHEVPFRLESGQLSICIAIPRKRSSLRIEGVAIARDGSGQLPVGPFESPQVRLDVTSFPTYGPRQIDVKCLFDDSATLQAVSLLPAGYEESQENITTISFTPSEPSRVFQWFARSPFATGLRYRPYDAQGGAWTDVPDDVERLVFYSSDLMNQESAREVSVESEHGIRKSMPRRPGRINESAAIVEEAGVVALGTSPSAVPTDELLYEKIDDSSKKMFVPRYLLDVQTVSGQQRYRISMAQSNASSTIEVNLVAAPAPSLTDSARDAIEYPHSLTIELDFLVAPPSGARKTLEFTDVTRNGTIVKAVLTFATLAERDDVYRAITEPERHARLIVRRFIEVSIPQTTTVPGPSASGVVAGLRLPIRPILNWPPKLVAATYKPRATIPLAVTTTQPKVILTNTVLKIRAKKEVAPAPIREAGSLHAMLPIQPVATHVVLQPNLFIMSLPTPKLTFTGRGEEANATRLKLCVDNWVDFSDEFFAASPDLPPCGRNKSASRTWVDILDADTGKKLYGFCALSSARRLSTLSFGVRSGGAVPKNVRLLLKDRRAKIERSSNAVSTAEPKPESPPYIDTRQELVQTVTPESFSFPPALHSYIFQGIAPVSGNNQLIRYRLPWNGTFYTYLQDASRPSVVYIFPDEFRIARRQDAPFTPFATVRVNALSEGSDTVVVFDYVVAPHINVKRLEDAGVKLLEEARFGAIEVNFQPLLTSDVRFFIDRPSTTGSVREQRLDASVVLRGALKDTLSMPLDDFRLLFDAMHQRTASLFVGRIEIDAPNEETEVIPFSARMDNLEGEIFSYEATITQNGTLEVILTNNIESPVDIQTLDTTINLNGQRLRGFIQGNALPYGQLDPGEAIQLTIEPETAIASTAQPDLTFDLSGVTVIPDPETIWNSILDRTTTDYYRLITVKAIAPLFESVTGREDEQILSIMVEFEGGETAELTSSSLEAQVRIDYSIDDVILGRPVTSTYRYTVTVIRADGHQDQDAQPREQSADVFYVSLAW